MRSGWVGGGGPGKGDPLTPPSGHAYDESYTKYVSALRDKLVKANHFCTSQLNKNQVKQSHYYNKTMHEISLEVGSLV